MSIEPNESEPTSPVQRLVIGAGVLIVVILTIIAAVFLASQDGQPTLTPTIIAQVSPSTATPLPPVSTTTITPTLPPTDTPTLPVTPVSPTTQPTEELTEPPAATETPTPLPSPTNTPTEIVIFVTATPAPPANQGAGGVCQPPPGWVSYSARPGDTLRDLADRTNTTVVELQRVNCLDDFSLDPGQEIFLPSSPPTLTPLPTRLPTRPPLPTPTSTSTPITPIINSVIARETGTEIRVIVEGRNFQSSAADFRAELIGPNTIVLAVGPSRTDTSFEASAPADQVQSGTYDLLVVNPNGRSDTRTAVFPPGTPTATPIPPLITSVFIAGGRVSQPQNIRLTITGTGFRPTETGFEAKLLRSNDTARIVELRVDEGASPASTRFEALIADFSDPDLQPGTYDVFVRNPDGNADTERNIVTLIP